MRVSVYYNWLARAYTRTSNGVKIEFRVDTLADARGVGMGGGVAADNGNAVSFR